MLAATLSNILLGVKALRRDWRSGELRLLMLALLIAVAAVTGVGFLSDRVGRALERDSAQMLGGDLSLRADEAIPGEFLRRAAADQLQTAQTLQFPSMVSSDTASQLVALKAVSAAYPLRGELRLADEPGGPVTAMQGAPEPGTVWVDAQLLALLGLKVGDAAEVGDATFTISRIIAYEPDRGMQFINVAPRLMMNLQDLPKTGLVGPGSRVTYYLLVAGQPDRVAAYRSWLDDNMVRGQRLSTLETNRPEVQRALTRAQQFLMLVALLTVMIAAVAVALAARRFSLRHRDGIAAMRCMGAARAQISRMLWVEFIVLGALASAAGSAIGYAVHQGLAAIVSPWLGTQLPAASWMPLWQGVVTGMLLLLGFAMPPLASLARVPPIRVLRRDAATTASRPWPAYLLGAGAFFLLILWISQDLRLSLVIVLGFLAALLVFAVLAFVMVWGLGLLRRHALGHPALRFALAGMARRRSLTVTQLCALAIGLMVLLLLGITRSDLLQGWQSTLPPDAPNTFLINIQPDQRAMLTQRLDGMIGGQVSMSPMVRGRLLTINGRQVSAQDYADERAQRMVDREFNLSYTDTLPTSNNMVAGRWLDPAKPEVSIESGLADTLGLKVGDTLGFDVAGRVVQVAISGLRKVDWDSFQANFFALLSPSALQDAPATYITSFHVPAQARDSLRDLLREFPNLTVFDIGSILAQVQHVLDRVVQAVQLLFLFTVMAGVLVLGTALYATRDERMHEVAVLRALGATGRQLTQALRIELLLLGAMAGLLAAFAAVAVAWVLAHVVFDFPMALSWWPWAAGVGAGMLSAYCGGGLALAGILKTPPLVSLRKTA